MDAHAEAEELVEAPAELLQRGGGAAAAQGVTALDARLGVATGVVPAPHGGGRGPVTAPLAWLEQQRVEAAKRGATPPDDATLRHSFRALAVEARRLIVIQFSGAAKRKATPHGNSAVAKLQRAGETAQAGETVSVLFAAAAGRPQRTAARGFAAGGYAGMDEEEEYSSTFMCVAPTLSVFALIRSLLALQRLTRYAGAPKWPSPSNSASWAA